MCIVISIVYQSPTQILLALALMKANYTNEHGVDILIVLQFVHYMQHHHLIYFSLLLCQLKFPIIYLLVSYLVFAKYLVCCDTSYK